MDNIKNIEQSINFTQCLNSIDNLIYNLLFSKESGYINLQTQEAVNFFENLISKYERESSKIINQYHFDGIDKIIEEKKQSLIKEANKHLKKEIKNWAYEVYENLISNCLLEASLNKNDINKINSIYNRALGAISWISAIKDIPSGERKDLVSDFSHKFKGALNSKDEDYISQNPPEESDTELFLKLWNQALCDYKKFLLTDLNRYRMNLSNDDTLYFNKIKNRLSTNKRTELIDELVMINTAITMLNIAEDKQKYTFIKKINDDFLNKTNSDENTKIQLLKRRMQLHKTMQNPHKPSEYYQKLLVF